MKKRKKILKKNSKGGFASVFSIALIGSITLAITGIGITIGGILQNKDAKNTRNAALKEFKESGEYKIYRAVEADKLDYLYDRYILSPQEEYLEGKITAEELTENSQKYSELMAKNEIEALKEFANDETKQKFEKSEELDNNADALLGTGLTTLMLAAGGVAGSMFLPNERKR